MSTSTLTTVLNTLVDNYGIGRRGTNTGTSASQITDDANLGGPGAGEGLSVGCQVLITGPASDTRAGDITQLAAHPVLTTGVAKVDPNFGGSLDANDTYIILYKPFRFTGGGNGVIDKVNEAARMFAWEKHILPITLVVDGDMLATATTDWTDTNTSSSKTAAAFPNSMRYIAVTDDGSGGGYLASGNIAVEESTSYYLEVTGWGVDADDEGTLVLWDVTNGAAITLTNKDIDRIEPEILRNTSVAMPSGCKQVQIRLTSDGASDVVNWSNVIFRKNDAHEFALPDRPVRPMDIGNLLVPNNNSPDWAERGEFAELGATPELRGAGRWVIKTDVGTSGMSLWYEEFVKPAAMAAATVDTDTTTLPYEELAAVAAELLWRPHRLMSREANARYDYALSRAAGVIDAYWANTQTTRKKAPVEYPVPAM